jgi:hypothetical protein
MKWLITCAIIACFSCPLQGREMPVSAHIADSTIAYYLKQINYWSSINKNAGFDNDSLLATNQKMMHYLKQLSLSKESLLYTLQAAETGGLISFTASGTTLRVYAWDSWLNTDMHYFNQLIQYVSSDTCTYKVLNDVADSASYIGPGAYFTELNTFTTQSGKTIYVLSDCTVANSNLKANGIKAYMVQNGQLNEYPFFKTKRHQNSSIDFMFDASYDAAKTLTMSIHFSNDHKLLYIPVVKADKHLRDAYWMYGYNGEKFIFKKRIKA